MNITTTANPAEPFKGRAANEAQGFDLYAELFAGFFPAADAGKMENAVVPEYLTQSGEQVLDESDQVGELPDGTREFNAETTSQPVELEGAAPKVDLYAELLSAFFPVPTLALPTPLLPEATAVGEGEISGDPFAQTLPETPDGPHLLPTSATIAADAAEFASAKPGPVNPFNIQGDAAPDVDLNAEMLSAFFPVPIVALPTQPRPEVTTVGESEISGDPLAQPVPETADGPHLLPTGTSIEADAAEFASAKPGPVDPLNIQGLNAGAPKPRIDDAVDEKLKVIGKAKGNPLIQPVIGRNERLPIGQDGVVCGMPTTKGNVETDSIVPHSKAINGLLPQTGNHLTIKASSTDSSEAPVEVEILELPAQPAPPKAEVSLEEAEPILEMASAAPSDGNVSASGDSAHLISAVSAAVQHRHETAGIVTSPFRPERIELENDKKVEPGTGQGSTLLQMFTNRVLVDARSSQTARTLVKEGLEADTAAPIFADALAENEQADGEAGFRFDTSVGGETQFAKPEQPQLSDARTRRVVLDQVGSQLNDFAAAQKPGDDKRVLTIKLSPAELGTVEITLSKSADGVIDAHFQTDNPHAQHAINETLAQLRDSLERSGMQVGSLNTSCTSSYSNPQGGTDGREAKHFGAAGSTLSANSTVDSAQKSEGDSDRLVSLRA